MKIIRPKWLTYFWLIAILSYFDKLVMAAFVGSDKALFDHQPWYPQGQNVDYSIFWQAVNPIFLGRFWYSIAMFGVDLAFFLAYAKVKRIPRNYLVIYAVFTAFNYNLFLEIQNVTVSMFAPLVFVVGAWAFLAIPLEKLPLGWSWNFSDSHVQCLFQCSNPGQNIWAKLLFELATNGPVLMVFLIAWHDRRKRKHECEACEDCTCGTCSDMCGYM